MPPEGKKFARLLYEDQFRTLTELSIGLKALPDRAMDVYGRFKDVYDRTTDARDFLQIQLATQNPVVRSPAAIRLLPVAGPVLQLTSAVPRCEQIVQPILAGFAALPLYPATEAYHKILLAFAGEPQTGLDVSRRVKDTAVFLGADAAKTITNMIAPRLLFLMDALRKLLASRLDKEVNKLADAVDVIDKVTQPGVTTRLLQRRVHSAESLIQDCLTGLDEPADNLNYQLLSASDMIQQMSAPEPNEP